MRFTKQLFFLVLFYVSTAVIVAQEIPVTILNALRNKPEDCLVGIGMARAESEWESMSLSMTRARVQIARALSSEVLSKFSDVRIEDDFSDIYTAYQEYIIEVLSSALLKGTRIVDITKTIDGTWWCAIYMPKTPIIISPQQIDFSDAFLYDLSKVSSIGTPRFVSDINVWISHLFQRQSEDMVYGFGVAKLETDMASFHLAKERAILSIAHTLHAEISSTVNYQSTAYEIDPDSFTEQFIENISVESEYEDTYLPLGLVDYIKTEDGSLWVALGCKVLSETRLRAPVLDFSDADMDEYIRRAREEVQLLRQ